MQKDWNCEGLVQSVLGSIANGVILKNHVQPGCDYCCFSDPNADVCFAVAIFEKGGSQLLKTVRLLRLFSIHIKVLVRWSDLVVHC